MAASPAARGPGNPHTMLTRHCRRTAGQQRRFGPIETEWHDKAGSWTSTGASKSAGAQGITTDHEKRCMAVVAFARHAQEHKPRSRMFTFVFASRLTHEWARGSTDHSKTMFPHRSSRVALWHASQSGMNHVQTQIQHAYACANANTRSSVLASRCRMKLKKNILKWSSTHA